MHAQIAGLTIPADRGEQQNERLLVSRELPGVDHVAVSNPDGSYVLVLTNHGGLDRVVPCGLGARITDETVAKLGSYALL